MKNSKAQMNSALKTQTRKETKMTAKSNYQGLYNYAKENKQSRNLFQEYWQEDTRQAPSWHIKLNPNLERTAIPETKIMSLQAQPSASNTHKNAYAGLYDYGEQNAVHTDIFKTRAHPNLSNWQASLKYEKGAQLQPVMFKEAA